MSKKTIELINAFFGDTYKKRFKRLTILIIIIGVFSILSLNIGCEYNEVNGWTFTWKPAAEIKIEKK